MRELATAVGAERVDIVHRTEAPALAGESPRCVPLGNRAYLEIEPRPCPEAPESRAAENAAAVERAVRALRAAGRRWQAERLPAMSVAAEATAPQNDRVRERITAFLQALANIQRAHAVAITVRGRVVASSVPLDELSRERLPFLLRRVAVEAERQEGRAHAELADPDVYVASFWFDAALVAFFEGPYAVDFFRHRARMVMRELSQLLAMLEEPPPGSASVAPIPE